MQGFKLAEVRPPDTKLLKAAITNEIAGNPWHRIKETCERLDLASIPNEESLNKSGYVSARLEATPAERHFDIAMRLYEERPDPELRRAIVPFLPKEIKPAIRRQIIEEFAHLQSIRGQGRWKFLVRVLLPKPTFISFYRIVRTCFGYRS